MSFHFSSVIFCLQLVCVAYHPKLPSIELYRQLQDIDWFISWVNWQVSISGWLHSQKYRRLRCLLLVKGLVICFYLGWSDNWDNKQQSQAQSDQYKMQIAFRLARWHWEFREPLGQTKMTQIHQWETQSHQGAITQEFFCLSAQYSTN